MVVQDMVALSGQSITEILLEFMDTFRSDVELGCQRRWVYFSGFL